MIEDGLEDIDNSFTFFQSIDQNRFDISTENKDSPNSNGKEVTTVQESDNADDSDYHQSDVLASSHSDSSDDIPLARYAKRNEFRPPLIAITDQSVNIDQNENEIPEDIESPGSDKNLSRSRKRKWEGILAKIQSVVFNCWISQPVSISMDYDGKLFTVNLFEKLRLRDIPLPSRVVLQHLDKENTHKISKDMQIHWFDQVMPETNNS